MKLNPHQIKAVLALPAPERYRHFIKQVVDGEEVWGLFGDGWVLAATDDQAQVLPFWPASEYAALCAQNEWQDCKPVSISLDEFMQELLPSLEQDNILPCIFYTPLDKGITPEVNQLLADLNQELEQYL